MCGVMCNDNINNIICINNIIINILMCMKMIIND